MKKKQIKKMSKKEMKKMSKRDRAILYIAREIVFSKIGERIPSVVEYSERYDISVGLIQKAIVFLQNENAVSFEKKRRVGVICKKY